MIIQANVSNIVYTKLYTSKRYKIYYGGRGGGKSWEFAQALILQSISRKLRILCTREIQRTITDSVYRLLIDTINRLGLENYFDIIKTNIYSYKGSEFIFAGLRHNINEIKSLEGIDICWVEEAEKVSADSWDTLIPTIRKDKSEIWISFNPNEEDDATMQRFIDNTPTNSIIQKVNYNDNPFFPEVLQIEMEYDKKLSESKYKHIWLGFPKAQRKEAVYRFNDTVNLSDKQFVYNEGLEHFCSWDFGIGDDTAIIFYQIVKFPVENNDEFGMHINIFDEYTSNNQSAEHYREILEKKEYNILTHYCDPSGKNRDASLQSWVGKLEYNKYGTKDWRFLYTHAFSIMEMVDNANDYLKYVKINKEQCPQTYRMLKKWCWNTDKNGNVILPARPCHDEYSHLGTSFYYAMINRFPVKKTGGYRNL